MNGSGPRLPLLDAAHEWLGLSAEYQYEDIERQDLTDGVIRAETHRVPLGVNFFHPSELWLESDIL